MTAYTVKVGESIWDVTLNATGTLANLDTILEANGLLDWTPDLTPGQKIIIPDSVVPDLNALRALQAFPVCNNSVSDLLAQINGTFDLFNNNWILATGFWNDNAIWLDTQNWND